jgi:K+-transporting ATPase ATPase C chain
MRRQLLPAIKMLLVMTLLTGLIYPLALTGLAQLTFPDAANGSVVEFEGEAVGSSLLGQEFTGDEFFHSRPSAADFDPKSSSGSNFGPTNPTLLDTVQERADEYRSVNGLPGSTLVPIDAVTSSASGLDPHISVANARLQAARVAAGRGIGAETVLVMIDELALEDDYVNVLQLNIALEETTP